MTQERFRIPGDAAYEAALGRVLFVFATLFWNCASCLARFKRCSAHYVSELSAGKVASQLEDFFPKLPVCDRSRRFKELIAELKIANKNQRNVIAHAPPASIDNRPILFSMGQAWTVEKLVEATEQFAVLSIAFNEFLHNPPAAWVT